MRNRPKDLFAIRLIWSVIDIFINESNSLNNFAISSDGIASGLQRSASTLVAAGNSLEQSIAMLAAGNKVIQDPEALGNAIKVLSMRIRGTKTDLEDAGEETDGMIENTAKLREQIKALTTVDGNGGVDILTESGEFRSTYDILLDIAEVWDRINETDPKNQAALLEIIAGKTRGAQAAAILQNPEDLKAAYEAAMDSSGSALAENEKHLDSIQGRIDLFKNSLQTMWMNFLDSSVIKFVVDLGTGIINLVNKITVLGTALAGVALYWTAIKKNNPVSVVKDLSISLQNYGATLNQIKAIQSLNGINGAPKLDQQQFDTQNINAYAAAVSNLTAKQQASALASAGLTREQIAEAMAKNGVDSANIKQALSEANVALEKNKVTSVSAAEAAAMVQENTVKLSQEASNWLLAQGEEQVTVAKIQNAVASGDLTAAQGAEIISTFSLTTATNGASLAFKGLGASIKTMMASNPVGWIMIAISAIVGITQAVKHAKEEMIQSVDEVINKYNEAQSELKTTESTISDLSKEYEQLSKGVDSAGNNIDLTTDEYARYNEICNQLAETFPSLVTGFSEQGVAILSCKGNVEELTKAYHDMIIAANNAVLVKGKDVFDTFKDSATDFNKSNFNNNKMTYNTIKNLDNILKSNDLDDAIDEYARTGTTSMVQIVKALKDKGLEQKSGETGHDFIKRAIQENKSIVQAIVGDFNQQVDAEVSKVKPIAEAYIGNALLDGDYSDMPSDIQAIVKSMVSQFDFDFYNQFDSLDDMYAYLSNMLDKFKNLSPETQSSLKGLSDLQTKFDAGEVSYDDYKKQLETFLDQLKSEFNDEELTQLKIKFGIDEESLEPLVNHTKAILEDKYEDKIGTLSLADLKIAENIKVEDGTLLTWDQLIEKINEAKVAATEPLSVKTYSALSEEVDSFNEIQKQTAEIIADNTEITQEYKDSLTALGISESDLADCFDDTNPLVVKNARLLNNLVKNSKSSITQNVKLARSQAMLKYKELYQQIKSLTNGQKVTNQATLNQVNALYKEMGAIQRTIMQYNMLEQELLGAANAYKQFEQAQETDNATDYMGSAEEMILGLGKAFNTAELGSETARAAITGLVPESVYQDLDTVDDKMAAIYDYFKNGKLSQYFTLEFDDDGTITSAEMKLGNLRKFIEDGLVDNNVFSGTDWQHFEFSDSFLSELDALPEKADKMQYFADKMGVTKEVAFAFIKSFEDHDIEWLNGDYSSLFDSLMPESLESDIYKNTSALTELEVKLANGKITAEEYQKSLYGLDGQLASGAITQDEYNAAVAELKQQLDNGEITLQQYTQSVQGLNGAQTENAQKARENAVAWSEASTRVDTAKKNVEDLTKELQEAKANGDAGEIQLKTDQLKKASAELSAALTAKYNLQEPTEVTIKAALDDIQSQMDQWKADNTELTVDVLPKLVQDENGKWTIPADVVATLDETEKGKVEKYLGLLNDQYTITVLADNNPDDSTTELKDVKTAAEEAKKAIEDIPDPKIDTSAAISAISSLQTEIDNITGTTVHIYEVTHKIERSDGGGKFVDGTAHANGNAHASGDWGLPTNEHNALVGELGQELVVDPSTGRYYTVGDNGAEMIDLPRGSIVFNHKQTESLLKNGYVTGRGKAYASGTSNNNIFDALKLDKLSKYAEKLCKQYEELVNGNVDLRKRPHLSPSYEHDLAMSGGYNSFIGSDGQIYASTSAETVTIGNEKSKYTIDITPVLENGDVLTSDALAEYIDGLVTNGSTQDLLDSDKYNLVIRAVPGEYDEKDWAGFEDKLSKYKDGYLDTLLEMFDIGGEKSVESSGFSSVGLASVAKDLQNNGSYDGKEVASAIDSTSDGMKNLDSLINQYVTDVLNAKSLADDIGTDLSKTKYGNVDTDNRQILNWDEKSIDKYSDAIESWGMKVDDLVGSYSTLLSSTGEFDGVDIAFTPILQTEDGPQLLDSDTVYTYINGLIDKASENGGQWTNEDLFKLDAEGLEVDGTVIKNLLEDIGDNALKTSQLLHYVGDTGAIANLEGEIESASSEPVATGENASAVQAKLDTLNNTNISDKTFTVTTVYQTIGSGLEETARTHGASGRYTKYANGTVHLGNNAYNNGNFGAKKTETALVGELGPEMIVRNGRWTTVGDNGAEFTQIKKGDIIFNHKQTEALLKSGYTSSRGKMLGGNAHAEGNAYVTIWANGSSKQQWEGTGYSGPNSSYDTSNSLSNAASDLSDAASDLSDTSDQFEEVFDWIEVRLQEIEETLNLLNAKLENAVGYANQNNIIDQMLSVNNNKLTNLQAGLAEYTKYAAKLLEKVPSQYQDAAQNGAIAITEFAGDADEETVNAINEYRDWADKVADLTQQIEELNAEIAELAKKKFDNVSNQFENVTSIIDNQNDKLEAQIDLMEDRGYVAAKKYYESMMVNTKQRSSELEKEKKALQEVLDQQVELGNIKVGSDAWYEMVNALYEVDAAIVDCTSDLEKYQNAINEIYWDNFDELINRLDYLKDETQGLIDIMDKSDIVTKPEERTYEGGTKGYWTADDVKWTDEGLASLGLYAQQMEIAEYKARQYAEAIDDLQKDYKDGKYSESEYLDKLNELTQAQYDSIQSYYDAQDAIKDLNSARIDSIKEGISKEIEAYEELINKKKEELDTEKDLYDFQKSIAEQQKNISDIQRKLSALSGDNSASAIAKRKKLEQELAEAKADLEEQYYDRSVSDRSDALDKEQEDFEAEKDAETEKWEKYLDDIESIISDSLGLVQSNASGIYDTLTSKAQEYNLTLSDSIMTPWKDGAIAVSDYQTTFDTAMSSTMDQLEAMKMKWQEIIDKMAEAAGVEIKRQQQENNSYTSAKYTPPQPSKPDSKPQETQKTITVGGKINAKGAKIYSYAGGQGYSQYFANDPIYTVLADLGNYVKVRYHKSSSGVTGFFRKSDVKAYAKGSSGVDKDQLAWIDEMGLEEIVLHAGDNGKLSYLSKGSSVIPHDISENLMKLGQLDPQDVLDRNRPAIAPSKSIINNEISINMDIAEVVHVDKVSQDTLPDLAKIVEKQMDSYMTRVNNSLKKFVR